MVSGRQLEVLDRTGVTARLFSKKASGDVRDDNLPASRVVDGGTDASMLLYEGSPEGVHVFYFPAEYDTDITIGLVASCFTRYDMNLLVMNYHTSEDGEVKLANLFDDVRHFLDAARKFMEDNSRSGKIVLMGRSVGCGAAIEAALQIQENILCLVLESGFDRTADFFSGKGLEAHPSVMEEDPFDNRNKMKKIKKPVMFIHSPRDVVLSLEQIEWLVAESRSKATQFQLAPSGSREELAIQAPDIYAEQLKDYINMRQGIRPPGRRRSKRRHRSESSATGFVQIEKLFD